MKLLDYMRREGLDDDTMAARINAHGAECTGFAVKKWKYGEREPDADTIERIRKASKGEVAFEDWLSVSAAPIRKKAAAS